MKTLHYNNVFTKIKPCHHCNKVLKSSKTLSCTKPQCSESYCYNCIKRFYVLQERANTSNYTNPSHNIKPTETFINLRSSKEREKWICFYCKGICKCADCNQPKDKDGNIIRESDENEKSENKEKNNIKSSVVKIDNYLIIEDGSEIGERSVNEESNDHTETEETLIQSLVNRVEIRGIKTKVIKKQCIFCKSDCFVQGEIFKFVSLDQFLKYLINYCMEDSVLSIKNSKNPNYIQNKEKLESFNENFSKNNNLIESNEFFMLRTESSMQ